MTMKLSEAILLGSTLSRQGFNAFKTLDGRRCALGAALEAVGEGALLASSTLRELWPQLNAEFRGIPCPAGCIGVQARTLGGMIAHLNDADKWTRQRIAAWLTQFEPKEVEVPDSQHVHSDGGPGAGELSLEATAS